MLKDECSYEITHYDLHICAHIELEVKILLTKFGVNSASVN